MPASSDYHALLRLGPERINAFMRAIRSTVRPGDRVVEVGCGIGTYALAARQAGAAAVVAIDSNPTAIAIARESGVEAAGVRVIESRAQDVRLNPRADVVIFEDFGGFAFTPELRSLFDHVRRHLARPGARYIPQAVDMLCAPATVRTNAMKEADGLPFTPEAAALLRKRALNSPTQRALTIRAPMSAGCRVWTLDPSQPIPARLRLSGSGRAMQGGRATGLVGWTVLRMPGGGRIDNAPGRSLGWRPMFFPFERPVRCRSGEPFRIEFDVALGPGPRSLVWRWRLCGATWSRDGCSLNGMPAGLLTRHSVDRVPQPSLVAPALADLYRAMDGRRSVTQIAARLRRGHPRLFADDASALDFVLDAIERMP